MSRGTFENVAYFAARSVSLSPAHVPSPVRQLVFSQKLSEIDDPRSCNAQLPESLSPLAGRGATNHRCG
jgi:hypothetical protein